MTESLMHAVTDASYADIVEKANKPVVFIIGAPWCVDCRRIEPMVHEFAKRYEGKVLFAHADFDNNPELKARFEVQHIPSIFLVKNGKVQDKLIEPKSIAPFRDFIEKGLVD